jgi:hypothetical protein
MKMVAETITSAPKMKPVQRAKALALYRWK